MARRNKLSPDPFEIEIEDLLPNGRGKAEHEGKPLEVHGALMGEKVMARYLFGRRMRGQAETIEVPRASPDRVVPRCPHFGVCGACTLQHLDYAAQLEMKQKFLLDWLNSTGRVRPERILAPLSAEQWNYRRKARLSVRRVAAKGRVLVGFRERDGRFVADMEECHVLTRPVAERLPEIATLIGSLDAAESIPQIEVTCGDDNCALIFRHLEPLSESDLGLLADFARRSGLAVLLQAKGPDSVRALEGSQHHLKYSLVGHDVDFEFEPADFVQVNGSINRLMVRQAVELLDPQKSDDVLDLFCGLGNFTLPLARVCSQVTGVEGDSGLVERASLNARRNGLSNARFLQADLYAQEKPPAKIAGSWQKVLLDPPRSGASQVLPLIGSCGAQRVVYISCNPETLARDAGTLVHELGFRLRAAGIMDMFPQTSHIESMVMFERETPAGTN